MGGGAGNASASASAIRTAPASPAASSRRTAESRFAALGSRTDASSSPLAGCAVALDVAIDYEARTLAKLDLRAAVPQRRIGRLRHTHHVAGEREAVVGQLAGPERADEGADLERERLLAGQLRGQDVAGAVGEVVLAERLGSL